MQTVQNLTKCFYCEVNVNYRFALPKIEISKKYLLLKILTKLFAICDQLKP